MIIGFLLLKLNKINNYFIRKYQLSQFKYHGNNCYIGTDCIFTYKSIDIGDNVYIGHHACFQSEHGYIKIGNNVMFGPYVQIHGGNHAFNRVGYYMNEINEKRVGDDGEIVIGNDVWVGAGTILLKGVSIGEGSIIGAGSIVTKSIDPYTIYTGVPSTHIRSRWDSATVEQHRKILYERYPTTEGKNED